MRVLRGVLWAVGMLLWPAVVIMRTAYHPAWGGTLSAAGASATFICGAGLLVLGRGSCSARRVAQWALWAGLAAGFALVLTARGDMRDLRLEDTIGLVLTVGCPAILLIWYAAERIPLVRDEITAKRVDRTSARMDALEERVGREARRVDAILRNVAETSAAVGVPAEDANDTAPVRRLRLAEGE